MMANGSVGGCVIDDNCLLMSQAGQLISSSCAAIKHKIGDFSIYLGRVNPQKKILSFPR
jgi:hypothetical protein